MNGIKFLIDENTPHAIRDQMLRRQPTMVVWVVGDDQAPPLGAGDPDILLWLERHAFHLITRNRHSMPRHLRNHLDAGHHVPGVLTLRPTASLGAIIDDLLLIWQATEANEYQDQIVHIPL